MGMTIDRTSGALLCVAALLAGCDRIEKAREPADVAAAVDALVKDYNSGNAEAAAAMDAPDYVGVFHGQPNTNGPAADLASMKAQMAAAKVHWQTGKSNVTLSRKGDLAIYEAPYTYTITYPNGTVSHESGNWIAIFRRQSDGTMKLWRSIGSDLPVAKQGA